MIRKPTLIPSFHFHYQDYIKTRIIHTLTHIFLTPTHTKPSQLTREKRPGGLSEAQSPLSLKKASRSFSIWARMSSRLRSPKAPPRGKSPKSSRDIFHRGSQKFRGLRFSPTTEGGGGGGGTGYSPLLPVLSEGFRLHREKFFGPNPETKR